MHFDKTGNLLRIGGALQSRVLEDFRIVLMYDTVESGRMQGIMSRVFG